MQTEQMEVDKILPYWRNPRKISDEAVNAVIQSIERYGMQQPIVVDESNTIIIGHTRYLAVRRMEYATVPVIKVIELSPAKVKQLRVMDNKVSEYSEWDWAKLDEELDLHENAAMAVFFPEINLKLDDIDKPMPSVNDEEAEVDAAVLDERGKFICPSCFHSWEMTVKRSQVEKGKLVAE